jgi:hypothetical protein
LVCGHRDFAFLELKSTFFDVDATVYGLVDKEVRIALFFETLVAAILDLVLLGILACVGKFDVLDTYLILELWQIDYHVAVL